MAGEAPSRRGGREILCVFNSFLSPGPALGSAQGKGGRLNCSVLWLCALPCYFGFLCARYHHTSLEKREIICLCSSGWELAPPTETWIHFLCPTRFLQGSCWKPLPHTHVSLPENFTLLSRVRNKPYDVFGCWLNETNLISGNLHRIGRITSCSVLWLNNAFQVSCLPPSVTGSAASCWLLGKGELQGRMAQSSCPPCLSPLTCPQDPELEAILA